VGVKGKGGFHTISIHAGEPRPLVNGSVVPPIFQSTTYEHFGGEAAVRYSRLSNSPTHELLNEKLAAIEGTESALVTGSGMAAVSAALIAMIPVGGHLLAQSSLYGGTLQFLKEDFPRLGRRVTFFNESDVSKLAQMMEKDTKGIYVESVSNPLTKILDLPAIVQFARAAKLVSFIDNTFLSPVNFHPHAMGFDIVLHSATKYLNGHTDVIAGVVAGKKSHVYEAARWLKHLGGSLDPFAGYLLNRGLKTLGVRLKWQNESALKLAQALEKLSSVRRVSYPGLASHPQHAQAKEWFRGFGGMLAFEYDGTAADTDAALRRLRIPFVAASLGGVETLVTRPTLTSHGWFTPAERKAMGIEDSLVRVSVGLEDTQDLIEDFTAAFKGEK